jgi:hypothetical protein
MGLRFAEKLALKTSGAEAPPEKKSFIAALKALRHAKSNFSANCSSDRPASPRAVRFQFAVIRVCPMIPINGFRITLVEFDSS